MPNSISGAQAQYTNTRDDRVILVLDVGPSVKNIHFELQAINNGTYTTPPIFAQAMYASNIWARGAAGKIEVTSFAH